MEGKKKSHSSAAAKGKGKAPAWARVTTASATYKWAAKEQNKGKKAWQRQVMFNFHMDVITDLAQERLKEQQALNTLLSHAPVDMAPLDLLLDLHDQRAAQLQPESFPCSGRFAGYLQDQPSLVNLVLQIALNPMSFNYTSSPLFRPITEGANAGEADLQSKAEMIIDDYNSDEDPAYSDLDGSRYLVEADDFDLLDEQTSSVEEEVNVTPSQKSMEVIVIEETDDESSLPPPYRPSRQPGTGRLQLEHETEDGSRPKKKVKLAGKTTPDHSSSPSTSAAAPAPARGFPHPPSSSSSSSSSSDTTSKMHDSSSSPNEEAMPFTINEVDDEAWLSGDEDTVGNCLFQAARIALTQASLVEEGTTARDVRLQVASLLHLHPPSEPFIRDAFPILIGDGGRVLHPTSWQSHAAIISAEGAWGDEPELRMLGALVQRNVHVVALHVNSVRGTITTTATRLHPYLINTHPTRPSTSQQVVEPNEHEPIQLYYVGANHYVPSWRKRSTTSATPPPLLYPPTPSLPTSPSNPFPAQLLPLNPQRTSPPTP